MYTVGDRAKPTGYVVGFPCQPFSRQNSSRKKGWKHAASRLVDRVIDETLKLNPLWAVYENVINIGKYFPTLFRKFRGRGLLEKYRVIILPVCPARTFRLPMRRPRYYFLLVRKDRAIAQGQLVDLVLSMMACLRDSVGKVPAKPFPLTIEGEKPESKRKRPSSSNLSQKWRKLHAQIREKHHMSAPEGSAYSELALTEREQDVLDIALQLRSQSTETVVVDVSQSATRIPLGVNMLPTFTTSSKLVAVSKGHAQLLSGKDKLCCLGIPVQQCTVSQGHNALHDLAGNAMHVDCVALAMLLAMSCVACEGPPPQLPGKSYQGQAQPQVITWKKLAKHGTGKTGSRAKQNRKPKKVKSTASVICRAKTKKPKKSQPQTAALTQGSGKTSRLRDLFQQ